MKATDIFTVVLVFLVFLLGTSVIIAIDGGSANFGTASVAVSSEVILPPVSVEGIRAEAFEVATASGEMLLFQNKDRVFPMASLTKIMTGLLLEEWGGSVSSIRISSRSKEVSPRHSDFPTGTVLSKETARTLLLVESDNDIAESIAETVGALIDTHGMPRDVFIRQMNRKAAALGLEHTHFENPTGLDAESHVSSASDLVRLIQYVSIKYPHFWDITASPPDSVAALSGARATIHPSNILLGDPGLVGAKTGLTRNALGALVLRYRTEFFPEDFTVVILRSEDRFGDGEKLAAAIEKAFKSRRK